MAAALDHLVVIIKTESDYLILSHSHLIESLVAKGMGSGGRPLHGLESQLCHQLKILSMLLNLSMSQFPYYKMGMIICLSHKVIVSIN